MFNTSILVALIKIDGEYNFLFEVRAKDIRQGGEISFPGGAFDTEKDKNFKDTAIRETVEELGIKENSIKILGSLGTLVNVSGITLDCYVGVIKHDSINNMNFNKDEVERLFTLPVSFFQEVKPKEYSARVVLEPSYIDEKGEEIVLLPAKELNLPKRYHESWGYYSRSFWLFETEYGPIWGMTATVIIEFLKQLSKS